jgi:hypothetical protein
VLLLDAWDFFLKFQPLVFLPLKKYIVKQYNMKHGMGYQPTSTAFQQVVGLHFKQGSKCKYLTTSLAFCFLQFTI